jgi:hypothetical protein
MQNDAPKLPLEPPNDNDNVGNDDHIVGMINFIPDVSSDYVWDDSFIPLQDRPGFDVSRFNYDPVAYEKKRAEIRKARKAKVENKEVLELEDKNDDEDDDKLEWTCPSCQTVNSGSKCTNCNGDNTCVEGWAGTACICPDSSSWKCGICRVLNEETAMHCIICATSKPSEMVSSAVVVSSIAAAPNAAGLSTAAAVACSSATATVTNTEDAEGMQE